MWTSVGFGAYLVVLALLAIRASRTAGESETEFYLAGRSLGTWVVALSAVASGRSAWLLLSMSGLAYTNGVAAVWFLPGYIVAELFLFVTVGRRLRRATGVRGDVTVGDFFASRFPDRARPLQAVYALMMILFLTAYVSGQLVAGAKGLDTAFAGGGGLKTTGLWITGIVVLVYVVVGGFRAVSWTDVAQVGLMAIALVVLPLVAVLQLGGPGAVLEKLGALAGPLSRGGPFVVTGLAVGLGSPGNPHILVRYMSVSDERKLSRAALVGTVWNVVMGWGALWIGLAGHALYRGLPDSETVFPLLAADHLHPLFYGLVMAALLAAIMSTVDSQILVAASAITRDLRRAARWRSLKKRESALHGRVASALLVLVAVLLGWITLATGTEGGSVISGLVNKLVLFAWGGLGAAIGPAVILALYRRRMSGAAALAAMLTGGITACVWRGLVKPLAKPAWLEPIWPWISYELTVAFPLALLVGWLVSLKAPPRA